LVNLFGVLAGATPQSFDWTHWAMHEQAENPLQIFQSVFKASSAFIYRCRNDENYTMSYMAGCVMQVTGYGEADVIGNRVLSYVDMIDPQDIGRVVAAVDAGLEQGRPWDVDYRLIRRDGDVACVRERGDAVYDADGQLQYLQGLVVDARAEVSLRDRISETAQITRDANEEITRLAGKISDSVRQLSFLSINARIEAARAGEVGAGFGVIATEINTLVEENAVLAEMITQKMAS